MMSSKISVKKYVAWVNEAWLLVFVWNFTNEMKDYVPLLMSSFRSFCVSENSVNSVPNFRSTFFNASRTSTSASSTNVALDSCSTSQFYQ